MIRRRNKFGAKRVEKAGIWFDSKWVPEPNTGCWLWSEYINEFGYGKVNYGGKCLRAHRLSYEIHVGVIPHGLDLDHLCRNRACVNPQHLEPVTRKVNLARSPVMGIKSGIAAAAFKKAITHCPSGHAYSTENTKLNKRGWRQCRECARTMERKRHRRKRLESVQTKHA